MSSSDNYEIAKEKLELLIQAQKDNMPEEESIDIKNQEKEVEICPYCKNPDIVDIYPLIDWNLGVKLYHSLIQPLECFVKEHGYNRQTSNYLIDKCEMFPNKDFKIENYDAKLTWGRADVKSGSHNSIFMYDVTSSEFNTKEIILMSYCCKFPTKRVFTYNEYMFSYAKTLEEAQPAEWSDLPGASDVKEDGLDNWLFYTKKGGFGGNDPSSYQIIGWNQEQFALYFTTQMTVEIKKKDANCDSDL
jgi:hypothetical protein